MTNDLTKTIVDEMCSCGHPRSQHNPQGPKVYEASAGHSNCKACHECAKFTWIRFIYESE